MPAARRLFRSAPGPRLPSLAGLDLAEQPPVTRRDAPLVSFDQRQAQAAPDVPGARPPALPPPARRLFRGAAVPRLPSLAGLDLAPPLPPHLALSHRDAPLVSFDQRLAPGPEARPGRNMAKVAALLILALPAMLTHPEPPAPPPALPAPHVAIRPAPPAALPASLAPASLAPAPEAALLLPPGAAIRRGKLVRFASLVPGAAAPLILTGYLALPTRAQGRGRLPAVVLMHGCAGASLASYRWAQQLRQWGYATLVVDSFHARHIEEVCDDPERLPANERAGDALGALVYLQSLRDVDADRVALIGWSHGASTALWSVDRNWARAQRAAAGITAPWVRFRAAGAFYPSCRWAYAGFLAPVLIVSGGADTWAPPLRCERMAERLDRRGESVRMVVYPGATHAFDGVRSTVHAFGHVFRYSPVATREASLRVHDFLARHLAIR